MDIEGDASAAVKLFDSGNNQVFQTELTVWPNRIVFDHDEYSAGTYELSVELLGLLSIGMVVIHKKDSEVLIDSDLEDWGVVECFDQSGKLVLNLLIDPDLTETTIDVDTIKQGACRLTVETGEEHWTLELS